MQIIAIVGLARSGKDTIAGIMKNRHGFWHYDFYRDVIVPLMEEQGISPSKENAVKLGNEMRAKFGMGVFGEKMVQLLKGKEKAAVTGARSMEELRRLEEAAERFYILKVSAPEKQRFSRKSALDPPSERGFFERDKNDLANKGLEEVLKAADYSIKNSGPIKELEKSVSLLMERLK